MEGKHAWFDGKAFYDALDATRQARNLNWKQVASESGVSASTLTRMAQGKNPDVNGMVALVSWSGLKTEDFVRSENAPEQPEPVAMISTYLRSSKALSPKSAAALDEVIKATFEMVKKLE